MTSGHAEVTGAASLQVGDPVEPGTAQYWDRRYQVVDETTVSWFQAEPRISLELIEAAGGPGTSIVDVGGGASRLVDHLLERGCRDVTVVDISQEALTTAWHRVGEAPVTWVVSDVRDWQPARTFGVWHDRAAYHFLTDAGDQQRYWQLVRDSVEPGGHVVIATFAPDGPESCSGLPVARYSADKLAAAMGEGFVPLQSQREAAVTPAGATVQFTWLLAQRT